MAGAGLPGVLPELSVQCPGLRGCPAQAGLRCRWLRYLTSPYTGHLIGPPPPVHPYQSAHLPQWPACSKRTSKLVAPRDPSVVPLCPWDKPQLPKWLRPRTSRNLWNSEPLALQPAPHPHLPWASCHSPLIMTLFGKPSLTISDWVTLGASSALGFSYQSMRVRL